MGCSYSSSARHGTHGLRSSQEADSGTVVLEWKWGRSSQSSAVSCCHLSPHGEGSRCRTRSGGEYKRAALTCLNATQRKPQACLHLGALASRWPKERGRGRGRDWGQSKRGTRQASRPADTPCLTPRPRPRLPFRVQFRFRQPSPRKRRSPLRVSPGRRPSPSLRSRTCRRTRCSRKRAGWDETNHWERKAPREGKRRRSARVEVTRLKRRPPAIQRTRRPHHHHLRRRWESRHRRPQRSSTGRPPAPQSAVLRAAAADSTRRTSSSVRWCGVPCRERSRI